MTEMTDTTNMSDATGANRHRHETEATEIGTDTIHGEEVRIHQEAIRTIRNIVAEASHHRTVHRVTTTNTAVLHTNRKITKSRKRAVTNDHLRSILATI